MIPKRLLIEFVQYQLIKKGFTSENIGHVSYQMRVNHAKMKEIEPELYNAMGNAINECYKVFDEENEKKISPDSLFIEIVL